MKQTPLEPEVSPRNPRWRSALSWVTFGLWVSGAAWLAARYLFVTESDFGLQVPAWAAQVLAVHGAVAMISLITFGAWLPLHVVPRLRRSCHRLTGFTQLGLLTILAVTGYGLYYIAGEGSRPTWSVIHWVTGLVFPVIFLVHRRAVGRSDK
jgi:hypothetical protein